jgi:protoheme IX farnesyltransferase
VSRILRPGSRAEQRWRRLVAYFETTKFRSVVLLTLGAVVGGTTGLAETTSIGAGDLSPETLSFAWARLAWATLAVGLGCMGANAITGYIDRRMDAVMERTKRRPLPSGRLRPVESLHLGVGLAAASLIVAGTTTNVWAFSWLLFGLVDSAIVYNRLTKPRTPLNVILGSPAGGAPVMVGAAAVTGRPVELVPFLVAALIVAWTPIHIWSLTIRHVDDYRRAGVPMLPVVVGVSTAARCVGLASLALCGLATVLALTAHFSRPALAMALGLQIPIVLESLAVMRSPTPSRARLLFKLSSPYLAAIFLLVIWQSLAR